MSYLCPFCKVLYRLKAPLYDHLRKDRCTQQPYGMNNKEVNLLVKSLQEAHRAPLPSSRDWEGRLHG